MSRTMLLVVGLATTVVSTANCSGAMTPPMRSATSESAYSRGSWIDPAVVGKALVYITNRSTGEVNILSFPQGQPVGAISGFGEPEGECVDAAGDVFVTDSGKASIQVFAHGGVVPIRTLSYPHAQPFDCSVDSLTGNLAVSNHTFSRKPHSLVAVFPGAHGPAKTYAHTGFQTPYCGYDNRGNLFIDGSDRRTEIAELPKGGGTIVNAFLNKPIAYQGSIQWDGQHLVIASLQPPTAYRTVFQGRDGRIVGSTKLAGTSSVSRLSIHAGKIIGPDVFAYVWSYPGGGNPIRKYSGFTEPMDAVVTEPSH